MKNNLSNPPENTVRIGIDVGGTFTHAVAIDSDTLKIIGRKKVATTHKAAEGVAKGIIDALNSLLEESQIEPARVAFIAHSTTQATNALLEGDVATVGILGLGCGASTWLMKFSTDIKAIELAPGKFLHTHFAFYDTSKGLNAEHLRSLVTGLVDKGANAIAISEAFSVDNPSTEIKVQDIVRGMGLPVTCGSEVSKLYGLKVRTRTAVINAAMLPKMIETANMTESSVRAAGIKAPIMIMRSDGGIMDIEAMRSRPILTMLSGPAAGVAAAMMYLNISDGIFLEVGGTSTDISVIRNGKALVKGAAIGGHRVYMRTLDVKTVGVAGGSMFRTNGKEISDVGPRSAHIAGLGYVSFNAALESPQFTHVKPMPGDPDNYLAIAASAGQNPSICLTPTDASNFLGLIPDADPARGDDKAVRTTFQALSVYMGAKADDLATQALTLAYRKCLPVVDQFITEYKLDRHTVSLVGGGGGAAALVPFIGKKLGLDVSLAAEADVISAIGVALALVRETIERNIVQPKQEDILRIREEAFEAVRRMGADSATIEIHVEVDPRANIVRATAFGAAGLHKDKQSQKRLTEQERIESVARSMKQDKQLLKVLAKTPHFEVFGCQTVESRLFGIFRHRQQTLRALDDKGVIRLQTRNGDVRQTTAGEADRVIMALAEQHSHYGDAGKILPDIMLLAGARIVDLSGVPEENQIVALARTELNSVSPDTPTIVIASIG